MKGVLTMFVTTRSLQRDPVINRIFDVLGSMNGDSTEATWVPPVDIFEDAEGLRIIAEVPGVKPEDVKISLEDNVLTVKGAKQQVAEEKTERVHRYERTYGAFERSFTLPASVEPNDIKANYDHGVLTITLPKSERAKPRQIDVEVGRGQNVEIKKRNEGSQWSPEQERSSTRREREKQTR